MASTAARRLKRARRVRHQIARAFVALENGQITLSEVLASPPDILARVSIYDLMRRSPKLGPDGTKKVLLAAKVWPMTRLGNLSEDERATIARYLPPRAK